MFLIALIVAGVIAVLGTVLNLVPVSKTQAKEASLTGGVASLVVLTLFNWACVHWNWFGWRPIFEGSSWLTLVVVDVIIAAFIFTGANFSAGDKKNPGNGPIAAVAATVVIALVLGCWNWVWYGQTNADRFAHTLDVQKIAADKYPGTNPDHMVVVGEQAARNKAQSVLKGVVATQFRLGQGEPQSISGHMWYIYDLQSTDRVSANNAQYTAPGYIKVDAENFDTPGQLVDKIGEGPNAQPIAIKYLRDGYFPSNLERHLYRANPGYYVDDPSLEIDDQGRPFWTATYNQTVVRWAESVPAKFVTVDAQTGDVKQYDLDKIPAWVDRVYSADSATMMLDWWGYWGQAPYNYWQDGNANRYKVSGGLNLIYTETGPKWQALMTPWGNDNSVQYVALMDTRSNRVELYDAPSGLQTEAAAANAINGSGNNLRKLDPTDMALHRVYSQMVWIGSMVKDGEGGLVEGDHPFPSAFQGVGILPATASDGGRAVVEDNKGLALNHFQANLASSPNNADPRAEAPKLKVSGVVASAQNIGNNAVIRLEGDKDVFYVTEVKIDQPDTLKPGLAKPGEKVTLTYLDSGTEASGTKIRRISAYTLDAEATATAAPPVLQPTG